jgi:hypothetical protein
VGSSGLDSFLHLTNPDTILAIAGGREAVEDYRGKVSSQPNGPAI